MYERVPMTQESYNKKKEQLENMESVQMPKIVEQIAVARAEGDLKENAEYHGQREAQGMLQAQINDLKDQLSRAQIVDPSNLPKDEIRFGATVKVLDIDLDMEEEITLVGAGDEDYDAGKYLITSPLGQGLIGKKIGDEVEIPIPKGTIQYKVLDINFNDE